MDGICGEDGGLGMSEIPPTEADISQCQLAIAEGDMDVALYLQVVGIVPTSVVCRFPTSRWKRMCHPQHT